MRLCTIALLLFLTGCATVIRPADIPQEFTQACQPVETILQLEAGLTNQQLYGEVVPDLIALYNVCARRHSALVEAAGIATGKSQ